MSPSHMVYRLWSYFMLIGFYFFFAHFSQAQLKRVGWFYLENEHALSERWSLNTDIHFRSTADFNDFGNLLVRNWVNYSFAESLAVGAGYAYVGSWNSELSSPESYYAEHRSFQQIQQDFPLLGKSRIRHRIRLEQRFFGIPRLPSHSLRSRYALNWKNHIPAKPMGIDYVFVENELFFNLAGRTLSGGNLLEQNRAYAGLGFAPFGETEIELGSYYEFQHDALKQTNHSLIFQLRLKTSW